MLCVICLLLVYVDDVNLMGKNKCHKTTEDKLYG